MEPAGPVRGVPFSKRTSQSMRGVIKAVSLSRKLTIEVMHASVPLVVVKTTLNLERLVKARATQDKRPSWLVIIAKAFCIVARDEPWLRTFYMKWPWPHFYEVPRSIAVAVVSHNAIDPDAPLMLKIGSADEIPLPELEEMIQRGKTAPLDEVPVLKRILRVSRMPLPLRRMLFGAALNIGRQRSNYFGTFAITSVASLGVETVVLRAPGPAVMTYGLVRPDHTMELLFHWDHRIYDGVLVGRAMRKLEKVLNTDIADELLASGTTLDG